MLSLLQTCRMEPPALPYLVPVHPLLLHLLEFPLELALALQPLLGAAHVQHPPVELLPVHVSHGLPGREGLSDGREPMATALLSPTPQGSPSANGDLLPLPAPAQCQLPDSHKAGEER